MLGCKSVACRDGNIYKDRQVNMSIIHSRDQNKLGLARVIRSEDNTWSFNHIKKLGLYSKRNSNILKSFKQ